MRTKYTCPFLMSIAYWVYKVWLFRAYRVFWKTPSEEGYGAYIVVQPRGKEGGWQLSCPFPKWMIFTEMKIRRACLTIYCHFRHPVGTFKHYQWRFGMRKARLISKAKQHGSF